MYHNTKVNMGGQDHFCVVNCSNRRSNLPKGYAFHQISARPFARWNAWIRAIGRNFRKKKGELTVTENTKVCGAHFVNKRKSNDPTNIDYVPTINIPFMTDIPKLHRITMFQFVPNQDMSVYVSHTITNIDVPYQHHIIYSWTLIYTVVPLL